MIQNRGGNAGGEIKWVTSCKIAVVHATISAESAATWVFFECVVTQSRRNSNRSSSSDRGSSERKSSRGGRGGNSKEQRYVHVTGDTSAENRVSSDYCCVFNAESTDGQNTMELIIEDKL